LSVRAWDDSIPTDPFSFGACSVGLSDFTLELMVDGVRYEYLLQIDCTHVAYEALFEYPENRRRRVFERTDQELLWQRRLPGAVSVKQLWTPRTLVLSLARRFPDGPVRAVAQSVATIQASGSLPNRRPWGLRAWPSAMAWFEPSEPTLFDSPADTAMPTRREQALALLRLADMGIEEVEVTTDEEPRLEGLPARWRKHLSLLHSLPGGPQPLDFAQESAGTQAWFTLIGPVLETLHHGSVLVVDELDASLHPKLSAQVIRMFHDPQMNPLGAQLIFTAHDVSLMAHLNRDEVWLTEKQADGSTRLGAISDFSGEYVRQSANLGARYLAGRFGSLPDINDAELFRALGLIG
ncbi:MAG: ATP-binding protein, partial [Propionibacteriaceae bacterium]|nr:ATP-binding protein [Propionibacteriaceae bacterium]